MEIMEMKKKDLPNATAVLILMILGVTALGVGSALMLG